MRQSKSDKTGLMEKAVSSRNLTGRVDSNRQYARGDFDQWVRSLLDGLDFTSVLDVCCGTGNQLVLFAARPEVSRIVGVDVSKEGLNAAKERLNTAQEGRRVNLKAIGMEKMFQAPEIKDAKFELISCFYGLYYSKEPIMTLNEMIDHLSDKGAVIIVGPYGKNNAGFFELLQRHFSLPELVLRSSVTFMEKEVHPLLKERCAVSEENFLNPISYPDPQSLIKYWRSSTFYFPEHEDAVARDIERHFARNNEFIIEKHIKAYIGRRLK